MKFLPSRFPFVCLLLVAAFLPVGFDLQAAEAPKEKKHMVFGHYMVCFFNDVEFYKREMELAQRHGIDGFALNAGQWGKKGDEPYVAAVTRMYEAAKQLGTGFKLFISADANGGNIFNDGNIRDMVNRFKDHPNQFNHEGKPVLSAWAGFPLNYKKELDLLKEEGTEVCFVPYLSPPTFPGNWSDRTVRWFYKDHEWMSGMFYFAADATPAEIIRTNATGARVSHELGKVYMAGLSPGFNSPNLRDFRGMAGYGAKWEGLIQDGADWVEIVTWSDYQEDSNLMPFRWSYPPMTEQYLFSKDESALDVTGYYAAWFKTGVKPEIKQDKIYFVYRNRSRDLTQAWSAEKQAWVDVRTEGVKVDQIHDDVRDEIYVTAFLTAPAELTVEIGGTKKTFNQPAGISHVSVPMQGGTPHFSLERKGQNLISVDGRKEIVTEATKENSVWGFLHLSNRTWTGAAAAGKAIALPLDKAELMGGALREGKGISIPTGNGNGLSVPVTGLQTGTYNVLIRYRNPQPNEARLTLKADGPERAKGTVAHYLPAFLPPTGNESKTTSVFWSLYDTTSFLSLECQIPKEEKNQHPWVPDRGGVVIEAIELIPVLPVEIPQAASALPQIVAIPGGSFKMGSEKGSLDEKPIREVTLSPFAIGKYEITNAQFEQFNPKHAVYRDGYSWRDSDPVIYVSWSDAAKYCNWLSGQMGLTAAYDEKTWKLIPASNGFRLPTEAQWEYVASGRGEGRIYPWGNEPPDKSRGQFSLEESMDVQDALRGRGLQSTTAVGSYPAGASRDGVMDLAGNVAEWNGDVYGDYVEGAQSDPVVEGAENPRYRGIRGGSWGYYNFSQRVADREFNNPGYPGYIYTGFRVALPEAGWKQIQNK